MLPFIHESYANIGKTFALVLLLIFVAESAVKFSMHRFKEAILGFTVMTAVSSVLGACLYFALHNTIVEFLERNSKYFYIGITEHFRYYILAAAIFAFGYVLCILIFGFKKLIKKFKQNQNRTKEYIDNAFNDSFDTDEE